MKTTRPLPGTYEVRADGSYLQEMDVRSAYPYRQNAVPASCEHPQLLNRGAPPNTSNQRVCADCGRTFSPPKEDV